MGTLSAQIAHIILAGEQSITETAASWTPKYLTETLIPWSQHVDLLWPTIDEPHVRSKVLNQVVYLVRSHSPEVSKEYLLQTYLNPSLDTPCEKEILSRIIANQFTPHSVRIAALQHYPGAIGSDSGNNKTVASLARDISRQLESAREQSALSMLSATIASGLLEQQSTSASKGDMVSAERLKIEVNYLTGSGEQKALALGEALCSQVSHMDDGSRGVLIGQLLQKTDPDSCLGQSVNMVLAAALSNTSNADLTDAVVAEFTKHVLLLRNIDTKLSKLVPAHAHALAALADTHSKFRSTYIMQLAQLNKRCQIAMLRDYIRIRRP
ncbi:hypothetical protein DL89DRAFT_281111 [Linderina pennispora]|uniref:Uncharacterized protein n=1 Tax=Linderina pennispora TaxID=61395 RepID=A0A1Y1WN95_9FUNG|nr:uncharacterized protein DL89DRAFT_281111 [Linderina pennispora]ORX74778.1 hypothetical protein DL89DRAFT_281111 [Linderina pennispora]